ncbi:MAG: inorganic phosphate transporter [Thermodesulfobacteriota bacterium]
MTLTVLAITLILVLAAEFVNGWTDAPNAITTVVSTRVLTPPQALAMAVVLNILGAMGGLAVATTIGKGIVDQNVINQGTIAAAMISIIVWSSAAARFGIPTSESHALVAGLTGAAIATAGPEAVLWSGWQKVLIGLVFSSVLGFGGGFVFSKIIIKSLAAASPTRCNRIFRVLQIFSAGFMAYNHGLNDGQKFIGIFALSLTLAGILPSFDIPLWVIVICASVMGIGTSVGGWKIIKKVGMQMVQLSPWQGFAAESGASMTILIASGLGIPLSTTHSITTSIMGVAASRNINKVRWSVSQEIILAWVLTFPICGTISFIISLIINKF